MQVSDLAAELSAAEESRSAAQSTIAELRRELADRQIALTAAQVTQTAWLVGSFVGFGGKGAA